MLYKTVIWKEGLVPETCQVRWSVVGEALDLCRMSIRKRYATFADVTEPVRLESSLKKTDNNLSKEKGLKRRKRNGIWGLR